MASASRYLWLKNDQNLSAAQKAERSSFAKVQSPETGRAWAMRLTFQDIYKEPTWGWAALVFDR